MPLLVTEASVLRCPHGGKVKLGKLQNLVRIQGDPVLIRGATVIESPAPLGRQLDSACAQKQPFPCTMTLPKSVSAGRSTLVFIGGEPALLDTITGLTNGFPPGTVPYKVVAVNQSLVREA